MMPLCTTTMRPWQSRCGCAFSSVGRPCVAHRVWPMPNSPAIGSFARTSSRLRQLARAAADHASRRHARRRRRPSRSRDIPAAAAPPSGPAAAAFRSDVSNDSAHGSGRSLRVPGAAPGGPAGLVFLVRARHAQGVGGHVLGDRRARRDVGVRADAHRRDELRVRSDERAVFDHRRVLLDAVVVAGNGAGADVDALADRRVAEVRQMIGLGLRPERRLLQLDEVADVRVRRPPPTPDADARTARCARRASTRESTSNAVIENRDVVANRRVRRCGSPPGSRSARRSTSCPARITPGPMTVSAPIVTSASMYVEAASSSVTPPSMTSCSCGRAARAPSSARSTRLLTPRSSAGESI